MIGYKLPIKLSAFSGENKRFPTLIKVFFLILTLLFSLTIPSKAIASNTYDMATTTNWNIRFDGPIAAGCTSLGTILTADIYGTGQQDIIVSVPSAGYNDNPNSGSLYIIAHSLYTSITGKGNIVDLAQSSNYTLRIDSPMSDSSGNSCNASGAGLGSYGTTKVSDLDSDGKQDLIIGMQYAGHNGRTRSGSVYVLYNTLIKQFTVNNTGNTMYLANVNSFNVRFDGPLTRTPLQGVNLPSFAVLGRFIGTGNFSGTGEDLVMTAFITGFNGYYAGSVYLVSSSLLKTWTGTGNIRDMDSSSPIYYSLRIDGHAYNSLFGAYSAGAAGDLDGDGIDDLIVGVKNSDDSCRNNSCAIGSSYLFYGSLLRANMSGTGNVLDLGASNSYNIRIDGETAGDLYGANGAYTITDLNGDGEGWLVLAGALFASHEGRTKNGSVYIIPYSLLQQYTGTGNSFSLSNSASYYLRLDGAGSQHWLGDMFTTTHNYFSLGKKDIVTGGPKAPSTASGTSGPSDWGWVYVISNSIINNQSNVSGNIMDMATTSNYSILYQGAPLSAGSTSGTHLVAPMTDRPSNSDLDGDGSVDILLSAHFASYTNGSKSGSLYVIYNFPHTISVNSPASLVRDNYLNITGTISAPNSVTNISGVQYLKDSNSPSGSWTECTASDGSFNSTSESFNCNITGLSDGQHTVYIRSYDANTSYTAPVGYSASTFTVNTLSDAGAPSCTDLPTGSNTPILKIISTTNNSVLLSFSKVKDPVDRYIIEYGVKPGNYKYSVNNISKDAKEFLIEKLNSNTNYYFRIRAGNGCSVGNWSNVVVIKTISPNSGNYQNDESNSNRQEETMTESSVDGYDVNVKILDMNEKPVLGAKVTLHSDPKEAITGENGIAHFTGVEKGEHKVLIAYAKYQVEQSVSLTGDVKQFDINVTLNEDQNLTPWSLYWIIVIMGISIIYLIIKKKRAS